jgi:hypothetical protein
MKLTLLAMVAIVGVATLVVFIGVSQWNSPPECN